MMIQIEIHICPEMHYMQIHKKQMKIKLKIKIKMEMHYLQNHQQYL